MSNETINHWRIIEYDGEGLSEREEIVATELPITVVVNGEEFATMVCTPGDLHDLVIGFLASEGIILFYDEIKSIDIDEDAGFIYVDLHKSLPEDTTSHSKRFIGSCCGKSRQFYFKSDVKTAKTVLSRMMITVDQSLSLMKEMQKQSEHFHLTGGVHNAALCTLDEMVAIRTDIGRHNALDKIYGHVLENKIPLSDKLIVFSGRISSEVLLKISKIGVGILISKSAPTDLALNLAHDLNITAIGFARGNKMNIYTHPERLLDVSRTEA
ncbi:FdhD protein [Salinibacillus kushneri]|uniref:Sulfur carrier protein FdhD n=1 Tax=Salinibacillus kushneri TaxID=237682 RepID=A0A1I0ABG6_9BACI|nr:formate dehydrogenase accessory sulfurtransferase FdhD [Salinibacillus kushneri]SES91526.1 FdhD protein [Salinibacillus kushneri]